MKNKLFVAVCAIAIVISVAVITISLISSGIIRTDSEPISIERTTAIKLENLGSAAELEGNIGIISIFADDLNGKWSFDNADDLKKRDDALNYVAIATDWLEIQAEKYNKHVKFYFAGSEESDLYYRTRFDDKSANVEKAREKSMPVQWKYIDENIDNRSLKEKYDLDSMVYIIFLNPESDSSSSAFVVRYYNKVNDYPYETAFLPMEYKGTVLAPAVVAHEILHLFGAPDLYGVDKNDMNYGTTDDYVAYCEKNHKNEIMYTTFARDENGNKYKVFDRITNDLTDITAYYVGWTDNVPPEVEKFGLVHSQYEYYKQNKRHNS